LQVPDTAPVFLRHCRARDKETGDICALKKVKLEKERDGFPLTSVREINVLLSLAHPNIVNVSEVVVGAGLDAVFMVMEYADHDLKGVMEARMRQPFTIAEVGLCSFTVEDLTRSVNVRLAWEALLLTRLVR
jgi:serine/threonine protein kinase